MKQLSDVLLERGLATQDQVEERLAPLVRLTHFPPDGLDRYPGELSGGQRQRVVIARALVNRPTILLADEPTGNLDPENKELILDLLFERASAAGATLLAVTHDHALLPRFDRVIDFADFRGAA